MKVMKKTIITLAAFVSAVLFTGQAMAGNWSIDCQNASCVAEQGRIRVFWMAAAMNGGPNSMYTGKLTGVEGIPITIEDYESVEKHVAAVMKKATIRYKASGKQRDATAEIDTSGDQTFQRSRSIPQSELTDRKVGMDYNLIFVKWLGDTRFGNDRSIKRYWAAAEYALEAYMHGTIRDDIEGFFILRDPEKINAVDVAEEPTEDTKKWILAKYISITSGGNLASAYSYAAFLLRDPARARDLTIVSNSYDRDIAQVRVLMEPGQTAKKLWDKNRKDLAFAKWAADVAADKQKLEGIPLVDIYLKFVHGLSTSNIDKSLLMQLRAKFETAIEANDPGVNMVTVQETGFAGKALAGGLVIIGMVAGAVIYARRKKNRRIDAKKEAT